MEISNEPQEITLNLFGMTCANCALRIEKGLAKLDGVEEARVNFARETAFVRFQETIRPENLYDKISSLGYSATEHKETTASDTENRHKKEISVLKHRFIISSLLAIPLLYTMVGHIGFLSFLPLPPVLLHPWLQFVFATPVQFFIGFPFYRGAYRALTNRSSNMDVLVVLGTSAAFFYSFITSLVLGLQANDPLFLNALDPSAHAAHTLFPHLYYETSAILITFIIGGKWIEMIAKGQSSNAIGALLKLKPEMAHVKKNSQWVDIPVEFLKIDDELLIKPGERIPADAIVVEGESSVDESMLTGESLPVEKTKDSHLLGGTINGSGALIVKTFKVGSDTVLASIIKTVEDAQASKAPLQKIADKISGFFVPAVILLSASDFLLWYFYLEPFTLGSALEKSIAILVIACPCALGLATPISILVGTGRAASQGILFRNADAMEMAAQINVIAFDKTGTITEGKPYVVNMKSISMNENSLLGKIAAVEKGSEHPLGKAIVRFVEEKLLAIPSFSNLMASSGGGIVADVAGLTIIIGKRDFLLAQGHPLPEELLSMAHSWEIEGNSIVACVQVGPEQEYMVFGIKDRLKATSKVAINALKAMGITPILLTGDNDQAAKSIGREVGIEEIYSSLLPENKAKIILTKKANGFKVAMAGDGINDAPALASADVGIAMGSGTDVAIESAGIILVKGDIQHLVNVIRISRDTVKNIRQNFFWALGYNALGIPIAGAGLLAPWISGAAMAFSSISVVLNALSLNLKKKF